MKQHQNIKITFNLDGKGIYYDPSEPIHLDGLLAYCLSPYFTAPGEELRRDDRPFDIPLPMEKWEIDGTWGWKASALFPEGQTATSLSYWRKKIRQHRIELSSGNPNMKQGIYREYNNPLPLLLCHQMVAYAVGNLKTIKKELKRNIHYLGKKRAYGKGAVIKIDVELINYDWSMWKDGKAMRWLPDKCGARLIRPRPPYWNNIDRVICGEIWGNPDKNGVVEHI